MRRKTANKDPTEPESKFDAEKSIEESLEALISALPPLSTDDVRFFTVKSEQIKKEKKTDKIPENCENLKNLEQELTETKSKLAKKEMEHQVLLQAYTKIAKEKNEESKLEQSLKQAEPKKMCNSRGSQTVKKYDHLEKSRWANLFAHIDSIKCSNKDHENSFQDLSTRLANLENVIEKNTTSQNERIIDLIEATRKSKSSQDAMWEAIRNNMHVTNSTLTFDVEIANKFTKLRDDVDSISADLDSICKEISRLSVGQIVKSRDELKSTVKNLSSIYKEFAGLNFGSSLVRRYDLEKIMSNQKLIQEKLVELQADQTSYAELISSRYEEFIDQSTFWKVAEVSMVIVLIWAIFKKKGAGPKLEIVKAPPIRLPPVKSPSFFERLFS